jgi:hypothetical protein
MKIKRFGAIICCLACFALTVAAKARKEKPPLAGWGHVVTGPVNVYPKRSAGKKVSTSLDSGALVPILKTKQSGGKEWAKIQAVLPSTLEEVTGWVEASQIKILPADRFPPDSELLDAMGGKYLEDSTAQHARLARYLAHRGNREPSLVCYVGSAFLPQTRLQVFERSGEKFAAGPDLEFAFSQMQTEVTQIQFRDLLGDGQDLLITHEPFSHTMGTQGVNMVIRRLETGGFKVLWQAPLELNNLTSYAPRQDVLSPPEKNIGQPGTVTSGTVEFRAARRGSEPVWKGKISFYMIGREKPVQTLSVEKACPWNGNAFAPLN